eukprot:jgi/Chlat1/1131/Chrsp111S01605
MAAAAAARRGLVASSLRLPTLLGCRVGGGGGGWKRALACAPGAGFREAVVVGPLAGALAAEAAATSEAGTDVAAHTRAEALFRDLIHGMESKGAGGLSIIKDLYTEDVRFRDPVVQTEGREKLEAMLRKLLSRARLQRGYILEVIAEEKQMFATWKFVFTPSLVGPAFHVDGVTHAKLDASGRIFWQRDYWDMLESTLDIVPPARKMYSGLISHILR